LRGSGLWLLGFLVGILLTAAFCIFLPLRVTGLAPPAVERLKSSPFSHYAAAVLDVCHQANARRFYDYTPNCTDVREHLEAGTVVYHWNDCRVRSDHPCAPRPPGVTRILAVGDSFTMGSLVSQGEAWPAALETWLRSHGAPSVEVLNRGVSGYDLYQITSLARDASEYDAGIVVLAFGAETLFADLSAVRLRAFDAAAAERFAEGPKEEASRLGLQLTLASQLKRLAKYGWLSLHLQELLFKSDRLYVEVYRRFNNAGWLDSPLPHPWRQRIDDAQRLILDLDAQLRAEDRQLVLLIIPQRVQLVLASTAARAGLDPHALLGPLATIAREHGIPVVDALGILDKHPRPEDLYYPLDGHPTAEGDRLLGESMGNFLLTRDCLHSRCDPRRLASRLPSGSACADGSDRQGVCLPR
jgi:hypothetical protein